jgi:hypothetical protein
VKALNRHYFLVCTDVLQHLHPLRPKTAKIESRQQARHWRSHKTVAEGILCGVVHNADPYTNEISSFLSFPHDCLDSDNRHSFDACHALEPGRIPTYNV